MATTKVRKRRVASYIGAGVVEPIEPAPPPEDETPPAEGE
jgi:hypothetical protein